jgi:hypothetical protein
VVVDAREEMACRTVNVMLGCWAKEPVCTVGVREGTTSGMMCAAWNARKTWVARDAGMLEDVEYVDCLLLNGE